MMESTESTGTGTAASTTSTGRSMAGDMASTAAPSSSGTATATGRRRPSDTSTTIQSRAIATIGKAATTTRSEEHTSELQSLMRISYAVFCLKKKNRHTKNTHTNYASSCNHTHTTITQHRCLQTTTEDNKH